jgi:hypothetical protein
MEMINDAVPPKKRRKNFCQIKIKSKKVIFFEKKYGMLIVLVGVDFYFFLSIIGGNFGCVH